MDVLWVWKRGGKRDAENFGWNNQKELVAFYEMGRGREGHTDQSLVNGDAAV